MRYHLTDTDIFYKQTNETNEEFFVRMINSIVISSRLVEAVRIHYDLKDITYNSNWFAVDYVNLSKK